MTRDCKDWCYTRQSSAASVSASSAAESAFSRSVTSANTAPKRAGCAAASWSKAARGRNSVTVREVGRTVAVAGRVDLEDRARRAGDRAGDPRLRGQKRHLAEQGSRPQMGQRAAALANLEGAAHHDENRLAGMAGFEQRLAARQRARPRQLDQL